MQMENTPTPRDIKKEMFKELYRAFEPWHNRVYFYLCMEDHSLWSEVFGFEYSSNEEMEEDMIESYTKRYKASLVMFLSPGLCIELSILFHYEL